MKTLVEFLNNRVNESAKYLPKNKNELKQLIHELILKNGDDCDLNCIDVSKITDMSALFERSEFNGDISEWDVSNVEDMRGMFYYSRFNGDISNWDVSNVKDMSNMFTCSEFNGDISNWDVSRVKYMRDIFKRCKLEKNAPFWYKK